ncbi:PREDICTED: uncharacterized protein LOC107187133 [Dufourea novaeangliae]|uniref:uncharacterized protein LOC107187133 n=1 Tax=Dufourea novaeangliae TaxID=178035 RepID=UPI000767337E|nr:PREDICTED: uncharacterized protein LOC107187133 [Dufourea novaeangliae]
MIPMMKGLRFGGKMIDERRAECTLSVLYVSSAILSVTSLTSLVTVWQHWAWTLDVCVNVDCGCILHCINTFSTFTGGDAKLCQFGVYGTIPAILVGLCLGGYHGYRCCIDRNLDKPARITDDTTRNLNESGGDRRTVVIRPKRRGPYKYWIPVVFLAILLCCLSLAHAVVMTDGYYKTCDQYRKRLVRILDLTIGEAEAIHNRLSCGAIFDFMDYLQSTESSWRSGSRIDTGFALRLAVISTWLNFFDWAFVFLLSVIMARRRLFSCC